HGPGACRFDDAADLACRLRRYRIAVDVDSAESGGGNGAGQLDGAVRWDHGEDDAARFHEVRQSSRVFEATLGGARSRRGASPLRQPQDASPAGNPRRPDRGSHLARIQSSTGCLRPSALLRVKHRGVSPRRIKPADALLAVLVAVVWGFAFVVTRVGLDSFSPPQLTTIRFLIAATPAIW